MVKQHTKEEIKGIPEDVSFNPQSTQAIETPVMVEPEEKVIPTQEQQAKTEVEILREQIKSLEKLVYATADKGRVFNYENSQQTKNPIRIKLSLFRNGIIVGWRTLTDELVRHPTTGMIIGESQAYELLILTKDNKITKETVQSYPAFSNARYNVRTEGEVIAKKEDFEGNTTYDVKLQDNRVISLDSRFAN